MNIKTKTSNKNDIRNIMIAALIGAVIGLLSFLPILVRNNGQYIDYGDYYLQYVPFIKELKRMIMSGNFSWSWNSFLGDSFISAYSYYTVFNPFAWFVAMFPNGYILYGTMIATLLKLSISMVGSMMYINRFCSKEIYAFIGALLYTFSGFTLVNTNFYFFLDVIAVFPFLMYGLELLITERKRNVYIVSLIVNASINYYFFVSTVILVIIYVICRLELYRFSSWNKHFKTFIDISISSIIGTGVACFALIPSFYAILGSGKATETLGTSLELIYWPQKILEHLRTLVAPIESGRYHAFFDSSTWSSTGVYLPIFGVSLVILWCTKMKDWLRNISLVLTVFYFVPILNSMFNLFTSTAYTRWLYGMALIFSLICSISLEKIEQKILTIDYKQLTLISAFTFILLLFPMMIYILDYFGISLVNRFASACTTEYFMGHSNMLIIFALSIINYVFLWLIFKKNIKSKYIMIIVSLVCSLNYAVYNEINYDLHATDYSNEYYYQKSLIEGIEGNEFKFEYRIDYPGQISNYSLFKNMPAVNYYNSLQNPNSSRFATEVGIGESISDTILINSDASNEITDALLSVKYYYDYDGNSEIPFGFSYLDFTNGVTIYENQNYIPMGYIYDSYCFESDLLNLSDEDRSYVMLQKMVVKESDKNIVNEYLNYDTKNDSLDRMNIHIENRKEKTCDSFIGTSSGFEATIDLEKDNIVFFSIPNDKGWEITVNGSPTKIIEVNYGLLGICCSKGENIISATYHTQGLHLGIIISCCFGGLWLLYEMINKNKARGEITC